MDVNQSVTYLPVLIIPFLNDLHETSLYVSARQIDL